MPRASFYRQSRRDDTKLKAKIEEIASKKPAWGYRMIWAELRKQGLRVNHKRVYRVYCMAELQKPQVRSGKKHQRPTEAFEGVEAEYPGHVFLHDRTSEGRGFRIFNVVDVFSRRGFEPAVERSLTGKVAGEYLDRLCREYGPPKVLRRDNGPEFRSKAFQAVVKRWRIKEEVIPKGQPFNNGHIESYQGRMREELLDREEFESIEEARRKICEWVRSYNTERPHSAIGYKTPMEVWDGYYKGSGAEVAAHSSLS